MKKIVFFILLFVFLVISAFLIYYFGIKINKDKIDLENMEYLKEKDRIIQINSIVTIMNKAIESNNKNNIQKDEKGKFIENDTNSIKVYLEIESRGSIIPMEDLILSENGGSGKIEKLFSDMFFEYKEVNYHKKTGRIREIIFKTIEE